MLLGGLRLSQAFVKLAYPKEYIPKPEGGIGVGVTVGVDVGVGVGVGVDVTVGVGVGVAVLVGVTVGVPVGVTVGVEVTVGVGVGVGHTEHPPSVVCAKLLPKVCCTFLTFPL